MKILIVDDEYYAVQGIVNIIDWEKRGLSEPLIAYSLREAKEKLSNDHIDVLLTDIVLGDGTGLELIEWVNEQRIDMVTIILSSHPSFRFAQQAVSLGVLAYLLKPVEDEELDSVITEAVKQAESFRLSPKSYINSLSNPLVSRIENYVQSHIDRDISRNEIADFVNLSPEYLSTYFKKEKGVTLSDYIRQERMRTARELLERTNLPVSIISENVGYESLSYFSSVFRQVTDCTPREYRKRLR